MAQNDLFRATYVQALNDTRYANVIAFRQENANGSNDPKLDLATAIETVLEPLIADVMADNWVSRCVQVRQLDLPGQDFFRYLTSGVAVLGGESLPTELAVQMTLYTELQGIGSTGRLFFSGIPIGYEEDNCITEAYELLFDPLGEALIANITSGGVSFRAGLYKGPGVFHPFTNWRMRNPITTVRSRKASYIC